MNNHTEDKTVFDVEKLNEQLAAIADIHNNAIQSCIDVVREMRDASDLVDDRMSLNTLNELEENLQSLKK